jgi:hypothetical protein
MKRKKTIKLYACGTISAEFHPSYVRQLEFYNTPEACSDDRPCTDSCGIVEYELVRRRVVQAPVEDRGIAYDVAEKRSAKSINLAEKIEKFLARSRHDAETKQSAVMRVLGAMKAESRQARAGDRKRRERATKSKGEIRR